jgi:DNA uptake protein ComE-like DNA-binding protein
MANQKEHSHPGQEEPRSHGETHHENLNIDLNNASEQELAALPMVGPTRARDLVSNRPFRSWEDLERVPGFSKGMVDDLRSGGALLGSKAA